MGEREESKYEKIKNIVESKLIDRVDKGYVELSEEAFGKAYSSDVARRMFYGAKRVIDAIEEDKKNNIEDEEELAKLEQKEIELKKERIRLTDIRTKLNRTLRASARRENNLEYLKDSINKLNELKPLVVYKSFAKNGNIAVLNFSDFHLGIEVDNYFNKYNQDIAIKRIEELISKTILYCNMNNVTKLHLIVNGDVINGFKHMSLIVNADLSVAESITKSSEIISNMIFELCKNINSVDLHFVTGNHAMMNSNKECLERDNFEYLVFDFIKLRTSKCGNLRIHENKYSDDIADIRIGNKLIIATHGNKDNPRTCSEKLLTFLDERPSYIMLGHYHHYEEYDQNNINVKVNGSIVSTDEYAFGKRFNSKPYQILVIHDEDGEEICTYKIKLPVDK